MSLNPLDLYDIAGALSEEERMVQESVARLELAARLAGRADQGQTETGGRAGTGQEVQRESV